MVQRLFVVIMIGLLALLSSSCKTNDHNNYQVIFAEPDNSPEPEQRDNKVRPIRVAISSVLPVADTINHYRKISVYIGEKLKRPIILIQRKSYSEISMLLINGGADIAFLSSGSYITYGHLGGIEPIVMQERLGVPYYYGYLIVHKDSDIKSMDDLKEKTFAFTDPNSYSGYIFIDKLLAESGQTPESYFGRYTFTYSHEKSLRAVAGKVVDAAAITNIVYENAKQNNPSLADSVKIIGKSAPEGTGPVVVSNNVSPSEKMVIKELFLNMHNQEDMQSALRGLRIDRFVPFQETLFDKNYKHRFFSAR